MAIGASEQTGVRHTAKSPAAFRTIAEVADELELPAHVLRFWETKFPQIRPLKRRGGRRYYRPEDVTLLRRIRRLLYSDGYTIKGVQRLLRESGARHDDLADRPDSPALPGDAQATDAEAAAGEGERRVDLDALRTLLAELEALRALLEEGEA